MKQLASHCVYLVASGLGLAKIGVAPDPQKRLRELQVGSPVKLELALAAPYAKREDARAVADELARRFAARRAHGHWYRVTPAEVGRALASRASREAPAEAARARAAAAEGEARFARGPGRRARARTEKELAYQRRRRRERAAKQKRAAKLLARELKQVDVAAAVGVTARTLRNWNRTPVFQRAPARERARAERARTPAGPTHGGRAEQQKPKPEREARRKARQQQAADARTAGGQPPAPAGAAETQDVRKSVRRGEGAADSGLSRHVLPLELEPFSDDWLAWYAERRHLSEIDMLNSNDAFRGIVPPLERRARERAPRPSARKQHAHQ